MADVADQFDIEIWPENIDAFMLFDRIRHQWVMGPIGPTALSYQAVESALRMMGTPRKQWPGLFDDIQVLEAGALSEIHKPTK